MVCALMIIDCCFTTINKQKCEFNLYYINVSHQYYKSANLMGNLSGKYNDNDLKIYNEHKKNVRLLTLVVI